MADPVPYTTVGDLRLALAPAGDQGAATAASLVDAELTDQLLEAQREVDARLASRYTVPFPAGEVPPLVAQLVRDIAAYLATLVHRRGQPVADQHPVVLRYDRAKILLADLAAGRAGLEGAGDSGAEDLVEATVVNPRYEGDLFTADGFGLGSVDRRWT